MKRSLGSLAGCAVLVLTSACSGGGDDPAPSTGSTGASPGESAPAAGEPTTEPSPEEPETPEVEPASGPDLTQTNLSVRAPEGWTLTREGDPFSGQASEGLSSIFVTEIEDFGDGVLSIQQQAEIAQNSGSYLMKPKILEPVEIDGREWYHVAGPTDRVRHVDAFGTSEDGLSYSVDIALNRATFSPAQRQELVDAVLASISIG
ncbi:hypothetical protein [Nocardioides sp.]|uniref:hypothetical protein n=1 Tax=Nocardioides sp. TaxID=35761 RepID=UPI00286CDFB9|nr:hypothetical protein [Nocardioides sp.]